MAAEFGHAFINLSIVANKLRARDPCDFSVQGGKTAASTNHKLNYLLRKKPASVAAAMLMLLSDKEDTVDPVTMAERVMTGKDQVGVDFFASGGEFYFVATHNGLGLGQDEEALVDATAVLYQDQGKTMLCELDSKFAL